MSKCKHLEPEASYHQSNRATSPITAFWSHVSPSQSFYLKFGLSRKSSMLIPHCGLDLPLYKVLGRSTLVFISQFMSRIAVDNCKKEKVKESCREWKFNVRDSLVCLQILYFRCGWKTKPNFACSKFWKQPARLNKSSPAFFHSEKKGGKSL